MKRLLICQRFLPHYRLAFYEALVPRLAELAIDMRFLYGRPMGEFIQPPWAVKLWSLTWRLELGGLSETAMVTPFLFFRLCAERPDIVVLEDVSNLLNSLVAAVYCRMAGVPYLVWGLGRVPGKAPSRLRKIVSGSIHWLYRGSSGFICYSRAAEQTYAGFAHPTYWAPNSCLRRPSEAWYKSVEESLPGKYDRAALTLVTIGELKKQKRVDVLLDALGKLGDLDITLDLIGDGPERRNLESKARELGLEAKVRFHGAVYDGQKKQSIMRTAGLGVLPGRGGLALQELMYNGLPVICGQADGTELDHVVDSVNGYLIQGAPGAEQIAAAVRRFYELTSGDRRKMALEALATVNGAHNVESMVDGFLAALSGTMRPAAPIQSAPAVSDAKDR